MNIRRKFARVRVLDRRGELTDNEMRNFVHSLNQCCRVGCVSVSPGVFAVSAEYEGDDRISLKLHDGETRVMKISEMERAVHYPTKP